MSAEYQLGRWYRRLGALVGVRAVRIEDEVRAGHVAMSVDGRAEQIRREALAVEESLGL